MTKPIIRWVGGKTKLLPTITTNLPTEYNRIFEPFAGGMALSLSLDTTGKQVVINDINTRLIHMYRQLKNNVEAVIKELKTLVEKFNETDGGCYYEFRDKFNEHVMDSQNAALFLILNKRCFNGLYRENKKGLFNVPWDKETEVSFDYDRIRLFSERVQQFTFTNMCLKEMTFCLEVQSGDFWYLDPPYVPTSKTANFASYNKNGFGMDNQVFVRDLCLRVADNGGYALTSNSNSDLVKELYSDMDRFTQIELTRKGTINSDITKRNKVKELLIKTY